MNPLNRGLTLALLAVSVLTVAGCTDNETDAEKLGKNAGDPGTPITKASTDEPALPVPKTQEEWFKQQKKVMGSSLPPSKAK